MLRIAWSLLSAVLLAAAPPSGQPATRPTPTVTLEQATRTLEAGRHRLAASQFRALATAEPGSARAWFGLGKSYEALARESFQKLQAAAPDSAWEALIVAEVLVSGERFAQALTSLSRGPAGRARDWRHPRGHRRSLRTGGQGRVGDGRAREGRGASTRLRHARRPNAATWRASTSMSSRPPRVVPTRPRSTGRRVPTTRWPPRRLRRSTTLPASAEVHVVLASVHRDQGRPIEAVLELKAALALRPGDRAIEEELAVRAL